MGQWMSGAGSADSGPMPTDRASAQHLADLVFDRVGAAVAAGVRPADAAAGPVVSGLVEAYAAAAGRTDSPQYRQDLAAAARLGYEPRAERYWQLMAVINDWPPVPVRMHLWGWFVEALGEPG
jgi:hypothetical protein